MIEPIMYVGIGFLVAGLLVIGVIPMVHARAVRLTQRRIEAMTPLSMAEIQADKDQLRAEFAMSTRRLEMSVEQMKAKTSSQLAEIGKKSEAVGRLKIELGEKAATLLATEARLTTLSEELQATQGELAARTEALEARERKLAETSTQLTKFTGQFHDASLTTDSQRVELVALSAHSEVLKGQIQSYEKEVKELQAQLEARTADAEAANRQLGEERIRTEHFGARVAEIEHQLVVQTTEAEILGRRVQELLTRLDQHERMAADREHAVEQSRGQAAAAQEIEANAREELAKRDSHHERAAQALTAEKSLAEEKLRQAQQERERLLDEIAKMKHETETAWASERMESAVMRERINDVAAEVARLTAALEGPSSPIEAILAREAGPARGLANGAAGGDGNGKKYGEAGANGGSQKSSLADRIRALQSRRPEVPQVS